MALQTMTIAPAFEDAFGRALLDHHEGRAGDLLLLESDDGSVRPADMQPAGFFAPQPTWPSWEQHVVGYAEGAILDLGAGAGRHSLYLQDLGHEVSAMDSSPGAVAVCRSRGIRDVRLADLRRLGGRRRWDTLLLMCGNLGLAGDRTPTRRLLTRLAAMTTPGGLLIGDSVDPVSDDPHVRLRLHYGALASPWWDQINIPPSEIEVLVEGTGWRLEERVGDDDGYAVVLRRR